MIVIPVNEGESIERAIKRYKRKFDRTGILKELRKRKEFIKPSVRRRQQKLKAIYIQRLKDKDL
jgi:small subunit ribosomal protein S21